MKTGMLQRLYALLFALTFAFGLSACNTMEGAGEDIEQAGDAIGDKAREHD